MGSKSVRTLVLLTLGVFAATAATAGVPDPNLSTVPNVLVSPGGVMGYTVTVISTEGPVDGALVQLSFSTEAAGLVCWCNGQTQPLIEGNTDASGVVTFNIAAGGCVDPSTVTTPPAVEVFANGFFLKEVGVVSPDAVDDAGVLPVNGWNTGGVCTVGLSDASFHTAPLKTGSYSFCTDMDSDLDCDLDDAVALTPGIKLGYTCNEAP